LTLRVDRDGAVAVITLDRAEAMNALDVETLRRCADICSACVRT
jgi:enoyl-CoA hydratase/carnithine racemase